MRRCFREEEIKACRPPIQRKQGLDFTCVHKGCAFKNSANTKLIPELYVPAIVELQFIPTQTELKSFY